MRQKTQNLIRLLIPIFIIGLILVAYANKAVAPIGEFAKERKQEITPAKTPEKTTEEPAKELKSEIPSSKFIKVPFLIQAPNGNWDTIHEEACEEAALIMITHFKEGIIIGSAEDGDREILDMIKYEDENGYGVSITLSQLNQIAKSYFNLQTGRVETNVSIDKIKIEIAAGRPVIVPAAGKALPNPNFRNGGPIYHMLVIKGYDKDGFYTNDPGTKKGEGFFYKYNDLFNAIHDWDKNDILRGKRAYLVFD